jgi:hypothetical protein
VDQDFLSPLVYLVWLLGAVAFVLGLIRMNSPATARNGNLLSAGGMALAIAATAILLLFKPESAATAAGETPRGFNALGWVVIAAGIALGGGFGLYTARREDDRDAAAGVAVQRGRRRRGGPDRDRRLPQVRGGGHRPRPPGQCRDRPRHRDRLDHVHRLADRVGQADVSITVGRSSSPADGSSPRCWPRSSPSAPPTCGPATSAWP